MAAANSSGSAMPVVDDAAADIIARVYCDGPLLAAVQRARVWPDSKDFVDTPMRAAPAEVLAAYHASTPTTDDEVRNFVAEWFEPGPPRPHQSASLAPSSGGGEMSDAAAVDDDDTSTLLQHRNLLRDWSPDGPPFAADMQPGHLRDFARRVHALWPSLARSPTVTATAPSTSTSNEEDGRAPPPSFSSLIPTPHPAVVPGERFRETYYWDSHWVVVGLVASGMIVTAEGVVRNMLHLVSAHGFVPNGARCYYLNRSQPPVLAASVAAVCAAHDDAADAAPAAAAAADDDASSQPPNDDEVMSHHHHHNRNRNRKRLRRRLYYTSPAAVALARDALPLLLEEYAYLTRPERVVRVYAKNTAGGGGDKFKDAKRTAAARPAVRQLSRYWAYTDKPRPESWREDTALAEEAGVADDPAAAARLWREVATAAESGHDFGSRWLAPPDRDADRDADCDADRDANRDADRAAAAAAAAAPSSLASIRTTRVVPADLNGLMLKMECDVAAIARTVTAAAAAAVEEGKGTNDGGSDLLEVGECIGVRSRREGGGPGGPGDDPEEIAVRFEAAAARRREAIADVLWDPAAGRWRDLLLPEIASDPTVAAGPTGRSVPATDCRGAASPQHTAHIDVFFDEGYTKGCRASDWVPLWCGAAEPSSPPAAAAVASLRDSGLVLPGGISTSLAHTGHQWDFPNAWAPLVHMLVEGCDEFGGVEGEALARSVARRWVEGNSSLLESTGFMHEKYDARVLGGREGGGGEYAPQKGFGWSNGVALFFIQKYCRRD